MCPKCKGDGIIGAGDRPWEKAGATSTCDMCGGTGKVDGSTVEQENQPANETTQPIADVVADESQVPNVLTTNVGDKCITPDGEYGTQSDNGDGTFTCIPNGDADTVA